MEDRLLELMAARHGHFEFESGHHGELWLDIPRLFVRPEQLRPFAMELAKRLSDTGAAIVVGPAVEGALLAQIVAEIASLEFGFSDRIVSRTTSGEVTVDYQIPRALRQFIQGKRVAVVDDVVNAGSAICATLKNLTDIGAVPVGLGTLLALGDSAASIAFSHQLTFIAISQRDNRLWEPADCPLCATGVPVDDP